MSCCWKAQYGRSCLKVPPCLSHPSLYTTTFGTHERRDTPSLPRDRKVTNVRGSVQLLSASDSDVRPFPRCLLATHRLAGWFAQGRCSHGCPPPSSQHTLAWRPALVTFPIYGSYIGKPAATPTEKNNHPIAGLPVAMTTVWVRHLLN